MGIRSVVIGILVGIHVNVIGAPLLYDVTSVLCDDVSMAIQGKHVIFRDDKRSTVFGIGKYIAIAEDTCRVIDFYNILPINKFWSDAGEIITFVPVLEFGRQSSCEEGFLPHDGLKFEQGIFDSILGKVTFKNTDTCSSLTYTLGEVYSWWSKKAGSLTLSL